jgi:hypothetical protein
MKAKRDLIRPLAALAALLTVVVVVAQWDTAKATYNPTMAASVSDTEAGANADVTTEFNIPVGDFNFDVMIVFTPLEFGMGDPNTSLGAHVADLQSDSTLGLLNNVCITALPVSFEMLKATTNTADTISFEDGFADLDGNTLPDAVDKYPDFLNTMYPGITPLSRSYGQTSVAGTPVSLNQVIFEPGTTLHGQAFDASIGYGSVSVLNDPTAELEPGSITDFCTPVANATTVFGITKDNPDTPADESGYAGRTNPTAGGDYTFTIFTISQGDADGDGIENDLDTCPFDVNEGDPRVAGDGDDDMDGIDNVCDPDPQTANTDVDDDIYLNRGDNCPLVSNPDNNDADGDRIGDACDANPNTPDGEPIEVYLTDTVTIVGPPTPLDYGVVALQTRGPGFRNPRLGDIRTKVHVVVIRNLGPNVGPAEVSLSVSAANLTCPVPSVTPLEPTTVTLDPGKKDKIRFAVTYGSCSDPSPPVDYDLLGGVAAPGDPNPGNDSMAETQNAR